jgi:SAM-dependent methyltransferase
MSDRMTEAVNGLRLVRGTAGYCESADALAVQYEEVTFDDVHRDVLHLVPAEPGRILDVGAGTGRDAAALAERGHSVVAVEPTAELRAHGQRLHAGTAIEWVDDVLPELALAPRLGRFDAVFVTAVWMHLDAQERRQAISRIAELLVPSGQLFVNLRHGPVPEGRHMFDVSAAETVVLGAELGLRTIHNSERSDLHGRDNVRWSCLVLQTADAKD